jgi:hypothetical protein
MIKHKYSVVQTFDNFQLRTQQKEQRQGQQETYKLITIYINMKGQYKKIFLSHLINRTWLGYSIEKPIL